MNYRVGMHLLGLGKLRKYILNISRLPFRGSALLSLPLSANGRPPLRNTIVNIGCSRIFLADGRENPADGRENPTFTMVVGPGVVIS